MAMARMSVVFPLPLGPTRPIFATPDVQRDWFSKRLPELLLRHRAAEGVVLLTCGGLLEVSVGYSCSAVSGVDCAALKNHFLGLRPFLAGVARNGFGQWCFCIRRNSFRMKVADQVG